MNILIIGKAYDNLIEAIRKSKLADKICVASMKPYGDLPNIVYNNFDELAAKASAVQADVAINTDKILIDMGLVEEFKKSRVPLFSVNKKWLNLETSRFASKELMNHYKINNPQFIKVPMEFPVVIKTDFENNAYIVNNMEELVSKMEKLDGKRKFLEEYLTGDRFDLLTLWDGKNIFYFNTPQNMTEVQADRLDLMKTKLNFMFSDEKADFLGFFTVRLIWAKNDWHVRKFIMGLDKNSDFGDNDLLYVLNSAIYQKLNEI